MCGIGGFIARELSILEEAESGMRQTIRYRGRDDEGVWRDRNACLFHARLAVIDVETGQQPMPDDTGRYVIVYNGEIYNYQELRRTYEKLGARFRTRSDTEVVLQGYRLKGASVCHDLNGMFAFAIWDSHEKKLFLARDRLGKKPLFWTSVNGAFFFSSTLEAFRHVPGWRAELSSASLALYGAMGTFPDTTTIYKNAYALPAASHASISPGDDSPAIDKYWSFSFGAKSRLSFDDLIDEYEDILIDAIRIRLRSDVPLALTFSGGVDSGTIAALCRHRLGKRLKCYTIDYHTNADPSEETQIARQVSQVLDLDWQYIHFDYHNKLLQELKSAYACYDQPCQQLALVYSQRLYEAIKPFATVVLSGNGADELFTGYVGDEKIRLKVLMLQPLSMLRPFLRHFSSLSPYLRLPLPQAFTEMAAASAQGLCSDAQNDDQVREVLRRIAGEAMESGAGTALDLKMYMSLKYSGADSNFRIPDISGLAAQVEVRSPYLDYRMVEFAARLPHQYKVRRLFSPAGNKYLPKRYYERYVPHDIAWSRKKGMGWNLRWDKSIAQDAEFRAAFDSAYGAIEKYNISSATYRDAWRRYIADKQAGKAFPPASRIMMNGFMLGAWLQGREPTTRILE